MTEVEKAKKRLSLNLKTSVFIKDLINGIDFDESITRNCFEELCPDLF